MAAAFSFAACSKKDTPGDITVPEKEWLLDRIVNEEDSVQLFYNGDATVKQFARFGKAYGWNDSTRLEYANGKVARFLLYEVEGGTRLDRVFTYNGDQLVRIDYYNFVDATEIAVTDHDSLVYDNGKLAECHHINGDYRNSFSVYTWENGNIVKEEQFSVVAGPPVADLVITYTYNEKPGLSASIKGNFAFLFYQDDYTFLSANALEKAEARYASGEALAFRRTVEYTYTTEGLLSTAVVTDEDMEEDETTILHNSYTFIEKN
ncbi:hypothetical protein CCY01nite_01030 [Chitinophaga cymbidii]|uniref:DUF4595 domain-containing protein n=2 Tax=Chitinophaga cymbidii TaxID=1096750 RepID=A0A512RDR0_9BACT|nr:hypothetical protein CCY01nite_01030 [Chitinophaga cymbidii]